MLIYSAKPFPPKTKPSKIKTLNPRPHGDNNFSASTGKNFLPVFYQPAHLV
jgi:hypothetical protein